MSRTSSHLRNALVSVSCTYVTMHVDDDDEAISCLPPPTPRYTTPTPLVPMANYSTSLRTDLYASGRNKVTGPSQICMKEYFMVPLRHIPRTSASTAPLYRVSAEMVPRHGVTRSSTSAAALHLISAPVDINERLDAECSLLPR